MQSRHLELAHVAGAVAFSPPNRIAGPAHGRSMGSAGQAGIRSLHDRSAGNPHTA
jgi:hypothetical protein